MNIGIVTTWFERGAAYVSRQYSDVLSKDFNIFIYARGGEEYAKKDSLWDRQNVWWGKKSNLPTSTAIDLRDFRRWLQHKDIKVVVFNEQRWWLPVIKCKRWKLNTVAYVDFYSSRSMPLFNLYDALLCNTRRHYEAFKWHPSANYIPWGTDINMFSPKQGGLATSNLVTFFHSCGYDPLRKNTAMVIRCFSKLSVPARLIVHSQVDIAEAQPELRALISRLVLDGKMEYIQKTVGAPGLYALGDVYVYPSMSEGIGLTISEALSCGLACILTDNPPMNEFAADGSSLKVKVKHYFNHHGDPFYWPKAQVDEMDLLKIMQYCATHHDWVSEAKISARKYAENNLNWKINSQNLTKIFNSLIEPSPPTKELVKKAYLYDRECLPYDYQVPLLYRIHRGIDLIFKGIGRACSGH